MCDRGTYLFTEKVAEVKRVGGQAMVLMNVPGGREDLITHDLEIEYIHLTATQREAVLAYLGSAASATATLGATRLTFGVTAPAMAGFSSRGPIPIANALVMKPDITAPGEFKTYWGQRGVTCGYFHRLAIISTLNETGRHTCSKTCSKSDKQDQPQKHTPT